MEVTTEGTLNVPLFFETILNIAGERFGAEIETVCVRRKKSGETGMGVPVNQPPRRKRSVVMEQARNAGQGNAK